MNHPLLENVSLHLRGLEAQVRDLEAQRDDLARKLNAAEKALAMPADQWGVRVWSEGHGDILRWAVESRLGVQGALTTHDLMFNHVTPEVRALHLGRTAGQAIAAAVADKVGKSLYDYLKTDAGVRKAAPLRHGWDVT